MAALASRETRRPVKVVLDRAEEHLVAGYRPSSKQRVRLGARRDGTLTLIEQEAWVVTGAYGGGGSIIGGPAKDLYACPNVRTVVWALRANTDAGRAFRAPGYVEGTFALEGAMDELAHKLGIDPLDLRLVNYSQDSPSRDIPYTLKGLREAYEMGAERIGWPGPESAPAGRSHKARARYGQPDLGWRGRAARQRHRQAACRMGPPKCWPACKTWVPAPRRSLPRWRRKSWVLSWMSVRVVIGDTLPTPFGPSSGGSVTLASITPAVREAAHDAKVQLLDLAAFMLDLPDASQPTGLWCEKARSLVSRI